MALARRLASIAAIAALSASCVANDGFICAEDGDCGDGRCEPDSFCSFSDESCDSGHRYGERSGPSSGDCVIAPEEATFSLRPGAHLGGVVDTVLKSDAPDVTHGDDPSLGCLRGSVDYVTLYRFDLDALPDGASIVTAELDLVVTAMSAGNVDAHRVIEDWSAGAASYRDRGPATMWADVGCGEPGSRESDPMGSAPVSTGNQTPLVIELDAAVIQSWADDAVANQGVALVCRDTGANQGVQTSSSEGPGERRPLLRVTYSP